MGNAGREPRDPAENPYWQGEQKPHVFEREIVNDLCLKGFEIILSSIGAGQFWHRFDGEEPECSFPSLLALHQHHAEKRLSSILLSLAVSYRALDDRMSGDEAFAQFKRRQADALGGFLTVYDGEHVRDTLRECCNKIIHAEDIRPVYDNGSAPREEGGWYMDATLELKGRIGPANWSVSLCAFDFFEAMLETAAFVPDGEYQDG